jgi:hypothetical protein
VAGEPAVRAAEEVCAGGGFLVGQDLGVGHAGVIVQGGVQEGVAAAVAVAAPFGAAQHFVPAAIRDAAQFLDVNVHQLAWVLAFVAADRLAGGAVAGGQDRHAVAAQDRVRGRGRHPGPYR